MRRYLTPSLVISVVALFVALGATGYAISKIPAGSVGTKQIKKNAVTSAKVKNQSLAAKDFKAGQLPAGEPGPAGSALAYGYVEDLGGVDVNVVPAMSKGLDSSMVSRPSDGVYCFQLETLWPVHVVAATAESSFNNAADSDKYATAQVLHNSDFGLSCPDTSDMVVVIHDASAADVVNWFFYVTLN